MGSEFPKTDSKKRGKYGRPCDMCAARRVRCVFLDGAHKCVGCQNHGSPCTNNRIRKKLGPKNPRRNRFIGKLEFEPADGPQDYGMLGAAESGVAGNSGGLRFGPDPPTPPRQHDLLDCFEHNPCRATATIPMDKLLPYLQVYQTWFYGYWPVLSVADLMLTLASNTTMENQVQYVELSDKNAMTYALCCSVCAAIATQMSFVTSKEKVVNIHNGLPLQVYADEATRVRNAFDYLVNPSVVTLLSSFFLYAHYVNHKGRAQQAIIYLREAISICQILGFHEPTAYVDKSAAEIHRWKKIYYMLLVTERFMCFEDSMPVILEACIEFPLLENEEYPSLLAGFTELVKVFSIPDKNFFGEVNQKSGQMKVDLFRDYLQTQGVHEKTRLIEEVQRKLGRPLNPVIKISDSQKLNILLSQSWIQAIAWHITSENGLLRQLDDTNDCFSVDFPLKIAHDFLGSTRNLPLFAFESNGPGICVKLLEIANAMTFAIQRSSKKYDMADTLDSIFGLVNQFKNDVTLPLDVYNKVGTLIASFKNFVPRSLQSYQTYHHATVEEIFEDDKPEELVTDTIKNGDMNQDNQDNHDHYYVAQPSVSGLTPITNTTPNSIADLFVAASQGLSAMGSNLLYLQACNTMGNKMSPVSSGTALANMMSAYMHQTPSLRNDRSDLHPGDNHQMVDELGGSTFSFI